MAATAANLPMKRTLLAFVTLTLSWGAAPCPNPQPIGTGTTLPELADFFFGDRDYASAILLATNSRTGEGFPYLSNPDNIVKGVLDNPRCVPGGSNYPACRSVCIPEITEAQRSRGRYEAYLRAISDMSIPEPWEVQRKLVEFPPDQPITVTTWIRADQVKNFTTTAPSDTWVTLEPQVQRFCQAFARGHNEDPDQLTLRLEQRFGLPPASNKTTFVRIRLARPGQDIIFRPCMNPSTSSTNCPLGPPDESNPQHALWIYRQYYYSFGQARPSSYPWTSLGYTFDWAARIHATGDNEFQKFGESEFVIRKGAPIEVIGAQSTAEYCKPR